MPDLHPGLAPIVRREHAALGLDFGVRALGTSRASRLRDDRGSDGGGCGGRGGQLSLHFWVSLKYSHENRREHDREHQTQRGGLAVVAAEAVLEGIAVDEQQHREGRVARSAAGEEERLEEHLRRRDELQDQHDEDDAAQLRQRDVPDLAPDARAVDLGGVVELRRHAERARRGR